MTKISIAMLADAAVKRYRKRLIAITENLLKLYLIKKQTPHCRRVNRLFDHQIQ